MSLKESLLFELDVLVKLLLLFLLSFKLLFESKLFIPNFSKILIVIASASISSSILLLSLFNVFVVFNVTNFAFLLRNEIKPEELIELFEMKLLLFTLLLLSFFIRFCNKL